MALENDDEEQDDGSDLHKSKREGGRRIEGNVKNGDTSSEEEEEEEEEPRLKYASLTKHLKPVYRNGDATSTFLVAGDKMVMRQLQETVRILTSF